jgi:hypothetical protein
LPAFKNHVHDFYLEPQLKALRWTDDRAAEEITYYLRECDATDDDARWSGIVFVTDVTPEEAYEHQLLHGFSVFPGVLAPKLQTTCVTHVKPKLDGGREYLL